MNVSDYRSFRKGIIIFKSRRKLKSNTKMLLLFFEILIIVSIYIISS